VYKISYTPGCGLVYLEEEWIIGYIYMEKLNPIKAVHETGT
jgi:hypothetical protein